MSRVEIYVKHIRGKVSRDFRPFFWLKDSTWAPYEYTNTVSRRYWWKFTKNVFPRSCLLRWHSNSISMVIDYADTVSAWSTTTRTRVSVVNDYKDTCQRSQRLRWHTVNYFTLEKKKLRTKVKNQSCKLSVIFRKRKQVYNFRNNLYVECNLLT